MTLSFQIFHLHCSVIKNVLNFTNNWFRISLIPAWSERRVEHVIKCVSNIQNQWTELWEKMETFCIYTRKRKEAQKRLSLHVNKWTSSSLILAEQAFWKYYKILVKSDIFITSTAFNLFFPSIFLLFGGKGEVNPLKRLFYFAKGKNVNSCFSPIVLQ